MPIAYSDGSEEDVLAILQSASDLSSTSLNAHDRYYVWPIRYHLCPERSNLLRHLDFTGLDVLELGAGMGAASRFIAENARSFVGVEGTESRAACLRSRLRDLDGWEAVVANIQDFETDRRFDAVCLIGVLEYSELYIRPPGGTSPFEWQLRHAASLLKPGGRVIVAIENQNGVKYWAGAAEDHTGRMFDGVCGYPPYKSPRTFSRRVLLDLCRGAGLPEVEEFYPWPDYKTPTSVIGRPLVERCPMVAADIAADAVAHEQAQKSTCFPWTLAIGEVAAAGLLDEFANSFLFVAGSPGESPVRDALLRATDAERECAWHYGILRKEPICTAFALGAGEEATPTVRKRAFDASAGAVRYESVRRHAGGEAPVLPDRPVLATLRRLAFADDSAGFVSELERFLKWAIASNEVDAEHLRPDTLDLTIGNAVRDGNGFKAFDIEWELLGPLPKSWFVLRNLFVARDAIGLFPTPPYRSISGLYEMLCRSLGIAADLHADIDREAGMQADVQRNMTFELSRGFLRNILTDRLRPSPFPRDPEAELRRRGQPRERPTVANRIFRLLRSPKALAGAVGRRLSRAMRLLSGVAARRP